MTPYLIGGAGIALLAALVLLRLVWRVAEPNEALVISGLGARGDNGTGADSLGFKIVVGRGTAIIPGFQMVRRLDLDLKAAKPQVECVDAQGIKVHVTCVVAYKVGDDLASIANAARRFLGQPDEVMEAAMFELFSGHLRAIVGGMTVETMLHDRQQLTDQVHAVIAQQLAGDYAAIVAGAAKAFENVGTMVVLNGADGIEDMLGKVLTMGGAEFGVAQRLVTSLKTETGPTNGRASGDGVLAERDGHVAG